MKESFVSEDQVHCPCTDYKVEQVKDPVFDLVLPKDDAYGFQFSMNSTGFLKV